LFHGSYDSLSDGYHLNASRYFYAPISNARDKTGLIRLGYIKDISLKLSMSLEYHLKPTCPSVLHLDKPYLYYNMLRAKPITQERGRGDMLRVVD